MKRVIFALGILVVPLTASATDIEAINWCLGKLEGEYKEQKFKCRTARDGSYEFCLRSVEEKYLNDQAKCQKARRVPGAAGLKKVIGNNELGGKVK